jgi:GNAT superfamily N-acetyltransferase
MEKTFSLTIDHKIVASCISVQDNENIYEINDVFVNEEYRRKGYGYKLIMDLIDYYRVNGETMRVNGKTNKKITIKICCEITNIPASKLYRKIFGELYRYDSRYYYFCIYL